MKNLSLNWRERIVLASMIGAVKAQTLKEAYTFFRILEKVDMTDDERKEAQVTVDQQSGVMSWNLPAAEYGAIVAGFEDAEADALRGYLERTPPPHIRDAEWLMRVVQDLQRAGGSDLNPATVPAKRKGVREVK